MGMGQRPPTTQQPGAPVFATAPASVSGAGIDSEKSRPDLRANRNENISPHIKAMIEEYEISSRIRSDLTPGGSEASRAQQVEERIIPTGRKAARNGASASVASGEKTDRTYQRTKKGIRPKSEE